MGAVAGVLVTDRLGFLGLVSDAYANRFNFGEPGRGYFYTAGEIAFKQWPLTDNAGYSKLTFWNQPGALAINASTGLPGWGMTLKLEQELTRDGRLVAIGRWGKSFSDAAIWDHQMGLALVLNNPELPLGRFRDDALGIAFNWVKVNDQTRDEYGIELFYRFPLLTDLDLTLAYQYVIDPANAIQPANPLTLAPEINLLSSGSAFSARLRLTF
jgi:carbohydrate-selective porin OprB